MNRLKEILKEIAPYRVNLQIEFMILQLISLTGSLTLKMNFFIIDILLVIAGLLIYFFLKDINPDEKQINKMQIFLKIHLAVGLTAIVCDFLWRTSREKIFFNFIGIIIMISMSIFLLIFLFQKKNQDSLKDFFSYNPWDGDGNNMAKNGDVILGIEKETKKPLCLKYKDRFLHMLVLGPTGCGKTSQILLPMINSDMKNHEMGVIVLEPKGDLAEKVYALAALEGRKVVYFNPALKDCPYFNPLRGNENDVIENLVTTLKSFDTDSKGYFQDNNENLIRRSVKVLKRLYGDDATLAQLDILINNVGGQGTAMVNQFSKLNVGIREKNENDSIVSWFLGEYFPGSNGGSRGASAKAFEACSGVRNQIQKLISNGYLNRVLNPPKESDLPPGTKLNFIDFDEILANGDVCALCSAQGTLRDLGRFLGFFLILQIQSAVFRRPGNEDTRRGAILYIDEFQTYANSGMQDMLTQGRSYRVSCVLATQNRALIGMNSGNKGKAFTDLVSTNARNVVLFPGANAEDANYYSKEFGEEKVVKENISISRSRYRFDFNGQKETVREDEKYEARFRPTDIIYREFGEVLVRTIKDSTVQRPTMLQISWLPRELSNEISRFIEEYNKEQLITDVKELDKPKDEEDEIIVLDDDYEDYASDNKNNDDIDADEIDVPDIFDEM